MIALNAIENDEDFLENLNTRDYRAQVREQKDEILQSIRRRIVRETRRASFFGSNEVKKMSSFLELFTQGITQEERSFLKVSIVVQHLGHSLHIRMDLLSRLGLDEFLDLARILEVGVLGEEAEIRNQYGW